MPVKNTANFLEACLTSIVEQTEENWELWAINDHSTDDSWAVLNSFAKKDKRIKVLQNNGQGIIAALRLAFARSKGQLITRMDSDDIMTPNKLAILKKAITQRGTGHLAIGQVKYFSEQGLGDGYRKYETWLNSLTAKGANFKEIYKECVIPSPCWLLHRADLEACEAFRPNRYPEDYDLCFRFYKQGLKVIPSEAILHQWRDYPNRTSRTDENYKDNRFLQLKLHYYLKLDHHKTRPLIVWGAGKKGKWIAKELVAQEVPFEWICNNEKKIGKEIYGQVLLDTNSLSKFVQPQLIITVAGATFQEEIITVLNDAGCRVGEDYFFFC